MFSVPALQYDYDALEGVISAKIMELHHDSITRHTSIN